MRRSLTSLLSLCVVACSGSERDYTFFDKPSADVNDASSDAGAREDSHDGSIGSDGGILDGQVDPAPDGPIIIDLPKDDNFDEDATVDDALTGDVTQPTRLIGASGVLLGMTTDDRIIFRETSGLWTIKAAPGAPRRLAAVKPGNIYVSGKTVFNFADVNWTTAQGKLTVWTPDIGRRFVGDALHGESATDARADGKYVLFARNLTEDTLDIVVAPSDLAKAQILVQGAGRGSEGTCRPRYAFAGEFVIIASCLPGNAMATLERFTVDSSGIWQKEPIANKVQGQWAADATGERVFFIDAAGSAIVAEQAEQHEVDRNVLWGRLNPQGSTVFYTVGDQLRQKNLNGAAIPVVTNGFVQPVEWSSDLSYVVYSRTITYNGPSRRDLFLTATDWFNPDPYVLADKAVATVSRSALTSDARYVLYLTDVNTNGVGTLNIRPVSRGEGRTLPQIDTALAGTDSLIVFSDNRSEPGVWPTLADLRVFDASKAEPPRLLQASVLDGRTFQVTMDRTKVVYIRPRSPESPDSEGIYLHPIFPPSAE